MRQRSIDSFPLGIITYERRVGTNSQPKNESDGKLLFPNWSSLNYKLDLSNKKVEIAGEGRLIEDERDSMQTVFSHTTIGGGVLSTGEHQEEVRFIGNPELICACLFIEELSDNE